MEAAAAGNSVVEDYILNYCMAAVVGNLVVVEDIQAVVMDIQD